MPRRFVTSVLYLVGWIACALLGGWLLAAVVTLLAWVACGEFRDAAAHRRVRVAVEVAYPLCLAYVLIAWRYANDLEVWALLVLALMLLALLVLFAEHLKKDVLNAGAAVTTTLFTTLYCGLLPSLLVLLRQLDPDQVAGVLWWEAPLGLRLLCFTLGVTMLADVGGFAGGKVFGSRRFAGTVSPSKTWEGLYGVLIAAALAGLLLGSVFAVGPLPVAGQPSVWPAVMHRLLLGLAIGGAGQLGDFGASIFKREAGLKDYGTLFPGHGGVLDRLDALLMAAPIVLLYARGIL